MTDATTARAPAPPDHQLPPAQATTRKNVGIWLAMLVIAGLEVFATYRGFPTSLLIAVLLALAAVQAFLGLMFFMHLRHERAVLGWSLVGALLFVLALMNQLWPDALRVFRLRLHD